MSAGRGDDGSGFPALCGKPTAPGLACGPLRRNRSDAAEGDLAGAILVAERAVPDDLGRILAAAGTVTLSATLLSHVSLLSREFGKPSVTLGKDGPVRLLSDEGKALLLVEDVVGAREPIALDEGDIVLLDGDVGTLEIPGGFDAAARAAVRVVFPLLAAYARRPDGDALAALLGATDTAGPSQAFVLEAALSHRMVSAGSATRGLVRAMTDDARRCDAVARRVERIRARAMRRALERCDAAAASVEMAADLDELNRVLRELDGTLQRDLLLIEDTGGSAWVVAERIESIMSDAAKRRGALEARLAVQVHDALALPDDVLRHRIGGLFRLLRSARGAHLAGTEVSRLHDRLSRQLAEERARVGSDLVVQIDDRAPRDRQLLGGKVVGLLEIVSLLPAGCRLPRGFAVTSAAYRLHLLGETGERVEQALRVGDDAAASRLARAAILGGDIPGEVSDAVREAEAALGAPRLAVRSSATIEDAPAGSRAGLFDTYLGVHGGDEVVERIRRAWASLWNARALFALTASGVSAFRIGQAVLVQEMIEPRAAGVLFSRDPGGRPDTLLVNANWGLGESISQGEAPGDLFWVRRSTGDLVASETGGSRFRIELDPTGTGTREVPLSDQQTGRPCLDADDLRRLASLALALERGTGRSQDVEFGFDAEGTLFVFQTRRIVPGRIT